MPKNNVRRSWIDREGQYQTMRGKTCRGCPSTYRVHQRCETVIKVLHKCELTHRTVNPDMLVCVMFPIQAGWKHVLL